jgi:hypothetical protein
VKTAIIECKQRYEKMTRSVGGAAAAAVTESLAAGA